MEKFKYSTDKLWACISPKNFVDYSTLSTTKEGSIKLFTSTINFPSYYEWSHSEQNGWKCIRLTVEFRNELNICSNEMFPNKTHSN
jgi:hypothetical protein